MPAPELVRRFVLPLEALGVRYMVSGSVAAMAYGEPRLTNDVDVVIDLKEGDAGRFAHAFDAADLYVPPEETIRDAVRRGGGASFNIIHPALALKADYFVAGDELAGWGLDHRRREPMGETAVWLAPPEYVIVRKLQYFRMGESPKHVDDVRSILRYFHDGLSLPDIEDHVARLQLEREWALVRRRAP